VEPISQTLERLKLVNFYGDDVVNTCQTGSASVLLSGLKWGVIKGNEVLSLTYRAH
jgi:hypothetical protein